MLRWLAPGLGVKRWFFLLLLGVTLLGVGLAYFLLDFYRTSISDDLLPVLDVATLRFLPRLMRVVIFGGLGVSMISLGIWGLNRALLNPFVRPGARLVDQIAEFRRRERGPKIVTLGGGHGMSTLLRGLKAHTYNLTAVVTVADDGGSSGVLRQSLGILPPGDIRNCLAALSNDEALLAQLFQYRFSSDTGLGGHSFGNLFISALAEVTGSFEEAVAEFGAGALGSRAGAPGDVARYQTHRRCPGAEYCQRDTGKRREQYPHHARACAPRHHRAKQSASLSAGDSGDSGSRHDCDWAR